MEKKTYTRRDMLKMTGFGMVGVAIAVSGLGGVVNVLSEKAIQDVAKNAVVPFYDTYQSGIITAHQSHIYFAALTFVGKSKDDLKELFQTWTTYSERLMEGKTVSDEPIKGLVPPTDTGDSLNLSASNLSITFGVGPTLFQHETLQLQNKQPALLKDLPHFPKDQLQNEWSSGDICIQACADDPQVAFHAVRNLLRAGVGVVKLKWSQAGFLSVPDDGSTPRNLFSFKDGTVNPTTKAEFDEHVWIHNSDQSWLNGGTYLAFRRIQMHLETWDRTALKEQENTFGRHRENGAAYGQTKEFNDFDHRATDLEGNLILPETSHVFLSREANQTIFRRPFSYSSGLVTETGAYDAGMMFISFQKNPQQFIDIQKSLGRLDRLNEYITHRGSALFAIFPGVKKGSYIGEALFKSL